MSDQKKPDRWEQLREAVGTFLDTQGPCDYADDPETWYCDEPACVYCATVRAFDEVSELRLPELSPRHRQVLN